MNNIIQNGDVNIENRRRRIQMLLPRHFKVLEMVLAGHEQKVIAETLGCTARSVQYLQRSPLFQAELARRQKESRESEQLGLDRQSILSKARIILEKATEKAALTTEALLDDQDSAIRLRAADTILDRVFGKTGQSNNAPVINISAEQVQLINLALKESTHENELLPADSPTSERPNPGEGSSSSDPVQSSEAA